MNVSLIGIKGLVYYLCTHTYTHTYEQKFAIMSYDTKTHGVSLFLFVFVDFINLCAETIFSLHILKLVEICILSQDVNNLHKFLCELEIKGFFSILM